MSEAVVDPQQEKSSRVASSGNHEFLLTPGPLTTSLGVKEALLRGMKALGFEPLLSAGSHAPIIVTFHMPADERFDFKAFYDHLATRGYVIYPGKLTLAPSFRIGCIGQVTPEDMRSAVAAVREVLDEMGVEDCGPGGPGGAAGSGGLVKLGGDACHQ